MTEAETTQFLFTQAKRAGNKGVPSIQFHAKKFKNSWNTLIEKGLVKFVIHDGHFNNRYELTPLGKRTSIKSLSVKVRAGVRAGAGLTRER